jgi:LmbE family N-acetylglucosaminyl deacetylase
MMRPTRQNLSGVARSLGLLGGRTELPAGVVVVSPHLDDAVLSLGAAIARATRRGGRVTVLTVLAGDPSSAEAAGEWDRAAGFRSAGEAAGARRAEDERACGLVGATPAWLPFPDLQYEPTAPDTEIAAAIAEAAGAAPLLVPGYPLVHEDHRRVRALVEASLGDRIAGYYSEQPYAGGQDGRPGEGRSPAPELVPDASRWLPLAAGIRDRRQKLAAVKSYASQLPLLGNVVGPTFRYELRVGGETVAWRDR